jgi:hypothetical protein
MGDAPHDTAEQPWRTALDSVERQVERGSLFTHTALSETAERVTEVEPGADLLGSRGGGYSEWRSATTSATVRRPRAAKAGFETS